MMKKIKLSKKHKKNINKFLFIILILISIEISLRVIGDIYLNKTAFRKNDFYLQDNAINFLTLGESSTAGLGVLRNESYPLQLERKLKELERFNTIAKEREAKMMKLLKKADKIERKLK